MSAKLKAPSTPLVAPSDLGAEGIGDHDLGGRYRLPGRVTDDAVYASDLKLGCSRSRDQDNEERCNLSEDHKPA